MVKYAQTPASVLEAVDHQKHALKMAQQSIVLLKNDNNTLPLKKNLKKIVVLGPNGDNRISILGNYNGMPSDPITLLDGLKRKLGKDVNIVYEQAINFTNDTLMVYYDIADLLSSDGKPGIKAEFYNNEDLSGNPLVTKTDKTLNHFWTEGQSPAVGVPSFHFSTRYATVLTAKKTEKMNF